MDTKLFHDISYGMYVISTNYNNKNVGCIINTFCQITSTDMLVAASVNKQNYTNKAIKTTKNFAISVVSEKTSSDVIGKFGFYSSKNIDKFEGFNYSVVNKLPILTENTCGYFVCELVNVIDCGTHEIFLAKVKDSVKLNENVPMTYSYYHKVVKGRAPKTAPTYIETKEEVNMVEKKYKCTICGYIYDDAKEDVKFEDLPADWVCPLCGVGKEMFEEVK